MTASPLVAFLAARLAEEEKIAHDAETLTRDELLAFYGDLFGSGPLTGARRAYAMHVSHFNPGRMLWDITGKQMILRMHNVWSEVYPDQPDDADRRCVGCGFNGIEEEITPDIDDCPVLRALALPYYSHRDYRKEWRP